MLYIKPDKRLPEMFDSNMTASFINADEHILGILHSVLVAFAAPPAQFPKALNCPQNGTLPYKPGQHAHVEGMKARLLGRTAWKMSTYQGTPPKLEFIKRPVFGRSKALP